MTGERVEDWALAYVRSDSLALKMAPPDPPTRWYESPPPAPPSTPGRPRALRVASRSPKTPKPGALRDRTTRARLLHTFWHHELQAAELMCWALLRFPDADPALRRGLLGICQDEVRHMRLYAEHIRALGHEIGDFAVRDWFWERVPTCESPLAFVSLVGMGLEGANLEHSASFAAMFRAVGDEHGALVQEQVGAEEIAHVAFATHWFRTMTGGCDFSVWRASLPPPLSPLVLRGHPLHRERRLAAGQSAEFIDELSAWQPSG